MSLKKKSGRDKRGGFILFDTALHQGTWRMSQSAIGFWQMERHDDRSEGASLHEKNGKKFNIEIISKWELRVGALKFLKISIAKLKLFDSNTQS